jgi:hypothetical protein
MGITGRLRRHPYALGAIALLFAVVGAGILALSGHWRSTAGAQGGVRSRRACRWWPRR